jgi:uncharacterized protein (DUF885 family)
MSDKPAAAKTASKSTASAPKAPKAGGNGHGKAPPTTPVDKGAPAAVKRLYDLADAYYEEKFERFPVMASEAGRHEFDAAMDRADEKTFKADSKAVAALLEAVEGLPEHEFAGDVWLDRRCLLAQLRTEALHLSDLHTWRRNPDRFASNAVDALFRLVVRHADDLSPVADALLSRLKAIPDYLEQAESVLEDPVPLWMELAEKTCDGVGSFLDSLQIGLTATGKADGDKIAKRIAEAKSAFASYAKAVGKMPAGDKDGYSLGTDRFEMLIRERLGMSVTAAEAEAMGRSLCESLRAELDAEVAKVAGGAGKGKRKGFEEVIAEARDKWKPKAGDLVEEYRRVTDEVRRKYAEADAVGFPPGEKLLVKPVPDFLRHMYPTAAYSSPGPFDADQTGIFWVNDLSKTKTDEAEKLREVQQHYGLALTCAHEAYPGHHLQFCTANRHPSKLRRMFSHAVYYEGWTLWCEQMTVDLGIDPAPHARLQQLHDALWRANRILIDCGLHTGRLTIKKAVKQLVEAVGFTEARAQAELNWYSQSPSVPMSYLIGKYENLRLKRKYVDRLGWPLRKFNDWLLSWGTVPQRWIEQAAG